MSLLFNVAVVLSAGPSQELEGALLQWLEAGKEPADLFLQELESGKLETWDHQTLVRLAWLYLSTHGRREGMRRIFEATKLYKNDSLARQAQQAAFGHETLTYFW